MLKYGKNMHKYGKNMHKYGKNKVNTLSCVNIYKKVFWNKSRAWNNRSINMLTSCKLMHSSLPFL